MKPSKWIRKPFLVSSDLERCRAQTIPVREELKPYLPQIKRDGVCLAAQRLQLVAIETTNV